MVGVRLGRGVQVGSGVGVQVGSGVGDGHSMILHQIGGFVVAVGLGVGVHKPGNASHGSPIGGFGVVVGVSGHSPFGPG